MTRILVVEDDAPIAFGLKNELKAAGYAVEVATDGHSALKQTRGSSFDLILLDIMLPGIDGYMVCQELRRDGNQTPILMLTAKVTEADKVLGLNLGADDYLVKPFGSLELIARVRALLRRTGIEDTKIHRFGDVEVDFTKAEVRRGGQPVKTTPFEFKLLSAFVRKRGRILTREQLLDEVWGPDSNPTDRVIDNHIMNLRRKIEPDPHQPTYLVSVVSIGYRFDG